MVKRNVVHIEIPAADLQTTTEFYQKLFEWDMLFYPEFNYATWDPKTGGADGGGFTVIGESVQPRHILIYVNSEDIEADLKKAVSLGAKLVQEKMEIPKIGWFGTFEDPSGNHICLYTSMDPDFNK